MATSASGAARASTLGASPRAVLTVAMALLAVDAAAAPVAAPPSSSVAAPVAPRQVVDDSQTLAALEAAGLSAAAVVFGGGDATTANAALCGRRRWDDLRRALADAIAAERAADRRAGVGMRYAHRLFDLGWLCSADARMELIAVVQRADREPLAGPADGAGAAAGGGKRCGELRLVYRLRLDPPAGQGVATRLPMTLNVVFWQTDPAGCAGVLARWRLAGQGAALAAALRRGPLAPAHLAGARLKSVEVNAQSVRWPSTVRPQLAGHAAYALLALRPVGAGLAPGPLENTPDVARLQHDAGLRGELWALLQRPASLAAIDHGTFVLPERFAARSAVSVAPHGLSRLANRPFTQVLAKLAAAADDELRVAARAAPTLQSVDGMLRRLDALSCQGCHQSRSVAGFHLLGEEPAGKRVDALVTGRSPHLAEDLARRAAFAAAAGAPARDHRPSAERPRRPSGDGERCGRGDAFASWTCAAGLRCVDTGDPQLGVCLAATTRAGDPCQVGPFVADVNPRRDGARLGPQQACGVGFCESSRVGFPLGACAKDCDGLGPDEACGAIPRIGPFNACLARREPFDRCVVAHARPAALGGCGANRACREDYVCARLAGGEGACMPPYFLFQLRVDGHEVARRAP